MHDEGGGRVSGSMTKFRSDVLVGVMTKDALEEKRQYRVAKRARKTARWRRGRSRKKLDGRQRRLGQVPKF